VRLVSFIRDESGAITVDWVTLAVIVLGLTLFAVNAVRQGSEDLTAEAFRGATEAIAEFRALD
jgi:hypothetical protein